jgi:ATP adenylyltransferase
VGEFPELTQEELAETGRLMQESMEVLKAHMAPDGFNIGMNLGRVAGAGVLGHAHYHVVPRWSGDANFMPVTGETRVMPEDVATTYRKLLPLFPSD